MTESEEWRPIPGFDGYEVSDLGRVRSWRNNGGRPGLNTRPRILKGSIAKGGYPLIDLRLGNRHVGRLVHRLVLEAFTGPCPEGKEACHADGDASNPRLDNLRWDTHVANLRDRLEHDTSPRGERHPRALLSERDVLEIASFIEVGVGTAPLARRFAANPATIDGIKSGRNWGWLTGRGASAA